MNMPQQTITSEKEKIELVNLGGGFSIARVTLEPGRSWIEYAKLQEKTGSCQVSHTSLIHSGRVRTVMDDETVVDRGPGDVGIVPPNHNTLVVGDEPCIVIDFS